MLAIEINNLVKQYKNSVRALDNLNFTVNKGEIFALLGPNGAGKSSLINILTTYCKPTAGNINMLGRDLNKDSEWIRTQIACVAQRISIDEHLSLRENMMFQSRLYKVDAQAAKKRINSLMDNFELARYVQYPTSSYSGGVKRRLDIAMNMVSAPQILFLDEPTVGMDVASRKAMWEMLLKTRKEYGTTIFLTTHYLEEADQLSDTICIMKDGKEMAKGTATSLRKYTRQNRLRITFPGAKGTGQFKEIFGSTSLIKSMQVKDHAVLVGVDDSRTALTTVNKYLLDRQIEFDAIEIVKPSLEDVFLALTGLEQNREEK